MIPPLKDRLSKTTITLEEFIQLLQGKGCFVIPNYQRGYVWGQRKKTLPSGGKRQSKKTLVKYVNINGKVSKDKWQSMFRCLARYVDNIHGNLLFAFMHAQAFHRAPFGVHASSVRSTRVLRSEDMT